MKKIGFIGGYDKIDLIMYIAKVLTTLDKKVLVIDSTLRQKAKYIVPVINPTKKYVTEYEDIDVAVGFSNIEDIEKYLAISDGEEMEYDIVLIDTDNMEGFQSFELEQAQKNYFVTSFDVYSLKKGLEALDGLKEVASLTKVLFTEEVLKEDDDYLNFLSLGKKIIWNEYKVYFPIENGDLTAIYENQRVSKIKFKKLSVQYKDSMAYLAEEIIGDVNGSKVRKTIKMIERGV